MTKEFDIVVIGSGLGGLVSAVILAKEGFSVCVLEKNNQFGGNLQTFSRDKMIFDTGVHYIGGLAEGQNLNQYFTYLGIMDKLKLKKLEDIGFDRITFGDDAIEYPHSQGYDNFVEQLAKFFPEERENLERYVKEIQAVCNKFPRYNLIGADRYDDDLLYINAADFIKEITPNKRLQDVLYGSNFLYAGIAEKTPLYVHALTINSYIQSSYKCIDGGSQISKMLIRELRKYDVEIHKHTEVTEFGFDGDNQLRFVKTKNKKKYYAKKFISNIDVKTTLQLAGHSQFKKSFLNRVADLQPTSSCFSVYIVLKPEAIPYFNYNHYFYDKADLVWDTYAFDKNNIWPDRYMLSCVQNKKNPAFAESLTAITYMNFDEVSEWENTRNTVADKGDRGNAYEEFKKMKADQFITKLEGRFPEIRSAIKEIYTSSPLSYRDYIGGDQGNMYGYIKDSNNPLKSIISPKTKVSNLYLKGHSDNMHGILGVTIGAFVTCSEILGKEVIDERLKTVL